MAETDSYLRRIGGGWPQPEYETCDICGRPNEDDEHHVTGRRVITWEAVE